MLLKQVRTTQKCLKPVQEILPSLASFSSESLMVSFGVKVFFPIVYLGILVIAMEIVLVGSYSNQLPLAPCLHTQGLYSHPLC